MKKVGLVVAMLCMMLMSMSSVVQSAVDNEIIQLPSQQNENHLNYGCSRKMFKSVGFKNSCPTLLCSSDVECCPCRCKTEYVDDYPIKRCISE